LGEMASQNGFAKAWLRCPMGSTKRPLEADAARARMHHWRTLPIDTWRPGYPLSGCFPAEPDSVSPGRHTIAQLTAASQLPLDTGAMPPKSEACSGKPPADTQSDERHFLLKGFISRSPPKTRL
jgi:hypothetical protein